MVTLLTVYSHGWKELTDLTLPAMQRYCEGQGYGLHIILVPDDSPLFYGWIKMQALPDLLERYQVVFALDADCLITNPEKAVSDLLDPEHDFYLARDANGYNAGSLIFRNSPWMQSFLEALLPLVAEYPDNQNAIAALLEEERWMARTMVLPQSAFNAYLTDEYPQLAGQPGWTPDDLVLHLPGLPLARRVEITASLTNE